MFHDLISHPLSKGEKFSIAEQVKLKVEHAASVSTIKIFPHPKTKKNSYCITGFMRNQAKKEADCKAKGSRVKKCVAFFASN